ncbi:hypothetical protein AMK59_2847 [Oryctes borbonicus]|uniref:Peptidase A2 domain-containing protein n=1 Tax=Oryctes borbonicus TaxID=1629725 RepID=A0A0T6BHQ5_9SCAR|nr:hypothetical protein AMK59_2847 [Oryctes borbonicus]
MKQRNINDHKAKAYLDTGSQVNVLSEDFVREHRILTGRCATTLKGFAEEIAMFILKVDEVFVGTEAAVTFVNLGNVDLIIGQPIIDRDDPRLLLENKEARLICDKTCDPLQKLTLDEDDVRPSLVVDADVQLDPGSVTPVDVNIIDVADNTDVVLRSKFHQLRRAVIVTPECVIASPRATIYVANVGTEAAIWKQGRMVVRGMKCDVERSIKLRGRNCSQDGRMSTLIHIRPVLLEYQVESEFAY